MNWLGEEREMWFWKWKKMTLADVLSPERGGDGERGAGRAKAVKVKSLLMHREWFLTVERGGRI